MRKRYMLIMKRLVSRRHLNRWPILLWLLDREFARIEDDLLYSAAFLFVFLGFFIGFVESIKRAPLQIAA